MKRGILVAILAAAAGAGVVALGVVGTPWTDSQTVTGQVNVVSAYPELLYICEPTGGGGEPCPGDDSGPDEIIFEGTEDLMPGEMVSYPMRLRNISSEGGGSVSWDIAGLAVAVNEVTDPGADCDTVPSVSLRVQGINDNHGASAVCPPVIPGSPYFGGPSGWCNSTPAYSWYVHVAPGGHEDMDVFTNLPLDMPTECAGNAWDITIQPTVQVH